MDNGGGLMMIDLRIDLDGGMICLMIGCLVLCLGGFSSLFGEYVNDRLGLWGDYCFCCNSFFIS